MNVGESGESMANHFLVFWACSLIPFYWQELAKELRIKFGIEAVPCFITLYFCKMPNALKSQARCLYKIIFAAGKRKKQSHASGCGKTHQQRMTGLQL